MLNVFRPAVNIEDCEGWWWSSCCGSVAEHWQLKPGVLGSIPGTFPLFSTHDILLTNLN